MTEGIGPYDLDELPASLASAALTVVDLDPYRAVITVVTTDDQRFDLLIDREGASQIVHALTDFLAADVEEIRSRSN